MKNLAGVDEYRATRDAADELSEASVPNILPLSTPMRGEVSSAVVGLIHSRDYDIVLERRWVYWSARVVRSPEMVDGAGLSTSLAVALNDSPLSSADRTAYSGSAQTLGSVVRADGFAGGVTSEMLRDWDGVNHWDIDTQAGLSAFVAWCKEHL